MVDDNEENKDENVFDNDEYEAIDEREVHQPVISLKKEYI